MLHDLAFPTPAGPEPCAGLPAAAMTAVRHGDHLGSSTWTRRLQVVNDLRHCVRDTARRDWATVNLRTEDAVARLGGDEFVVILPRLEDAHDVDRVADKLRKIVAKRLKINGLLEFRLTASAGTAVFDPDLDDARSLVARADVAMYAAKKRTGRVT
jgi:diguanylate cyclase (GGDEF)-like protein